MDMEGTLPLDNMQREAAISIRYFNFSFVNVCNNSLLYWPSLINGLMDV